MIQIRYNIDDFAMLDKQFSFKYDNYLDNISFNNLRETIIFRLFITLDKYRLNEIDKAIFITGKTYWIRTKQGKFFNKAKGLIPRSLTYNDYKALLDKQNVITGKKITKQKRF